MTGLLRDLQFGLRTLIRTPVVTLAAITALAIGIGANTTVFSLVDALAIRALSVADPASFVRIHPLAANGRTESVSYPDYRELAAQTKAFSALAAIDTRGFGIIEDGRLDMVSGQFVSPNYFSVVGIQPVAGRGFLQGEEGAAGGQTIAVIGYGLWQRRFGGQPEVLGKTFNIRHRPTTIVGIAPRDFQGTDVGDSGSEIWVPVEAGAGAGYRGWELVGRMKPGVGLSQAQSEMAVLIRQLAANHPDTVKLAGAALVAEQQVFRERMKGYAPLALVILVLVIACATVQNLMLARAEARQREVAIRGALGASRWRLVRQMLSESALLSLLGAGVGLILARWLIDLLPTLLPESSRSSAVVFQIDVRVLAFTACASCLSVLLFGLAPALRASRINLVPALKGGQNAPLRAWRRFSIRDGLVVSQVAISLVLLVGSALLVFSLVNSYRVELGFKRWPMLFQTVLPPGSVRSAQLPAFYDMVVERARALPGVRNAALTTRVPLAGHGTGARQRVYVDGMQLPPGEDALAVRFSAVSHTYLDTMGTRVLLGRSFLASDTADSAKVAIINQTLARRLWPGHDPIGKSIKTGGPAGVDRQVVGVVEDGKYIAPNDPPEPYLYLSHAQFFWGETTLVLQTSVAPDSLRGPVTQLLRELNPDWPPSAASSLDQHLRENMWIEHALARLVSGFGVLALILTCVGIYGVVSYSVNRRTREIGIRIALGARPSAMMSRVIGQGMLLCLVGSVAGVAGGFALSNLLRARLFGVTARDPWAFIFGVAVVAAITALACAVPARRASRVDPSVALREE